jgi:hypothetical protein
MNIYNSTAATANYTQQLNSSLVDPLNVPTIENNQENFGQGQLPDSDPKSTMSGDNVDLSGKKEQSLGMDSSTEILSS